MTFTGSGIWDMTRIWAGILSVGPNTEIESMTHTSFTDIARQGVHLLRFCGAGLTVKEFEEKSVAGNGGLGGIAIIPPLCVADALGLDVVDVKEKVEPIIWEEDHQSHWLNETIPAGYVASHMASASSLFNRAPDVLAAEPGIREIWTYQPLRPSALN